MRRASVLLATLFLTTTPAQAEVTAQSENGFAVRHVVTVSVDPDAAFAMLRTPAKWWDKDHTWTGNADNLYMDAQAGGCFCELIPNEATTESGAPQRTLRGSVQHMQIVYVDPGKLLRLSGALGPLQGEALVGTMTIALAPIKGGTRLTFEYVAGGFMRMRPAEIAPAVDGVLGAQASRLGMALGPLVGAGDPPGAKDATGDAASTGSGSDDVKALVTDLQPDENPADSEPYANVDDIMSDVVSPSPASDAAADAKDAARADPKATAPGAPKRYKPGTRPLTRPPRDNDEDEVGR